MALNASAASLSVDSAAASSPMPMLIGAVGGAGLLAGVFYFKRKRAKAQASERKADDERSAKESEDDAPLTMDQILAASKSSTSKTSPRPPLAPIPLSDKSSRLSDDGGGSLSPRNSITKKLSLDTSTILPALPRPKLMSANWRPPPKHKNLEAMGIFGTPHQDDTVSALPSESPEAKIRHNSRRGRVSGTNDPRKRSCMMVSLLLSSQHSSLHSPRARSPAVRRLSRNSHSRNRQPNRLLLRRAAPAS